MSTDLVAQQESTKSFTPSATDGGRSSSNEEKGIDAADDGTDSSLAGTADMLATAVTKDRHSAFDPHSEENLEYSASLLPMSPNSMVEAAYRAGVEHRKKRDADRMSRENETTGGEFSAYIDTSNTALGDTSPDFENKRLRLSQADLDSLAAHDVTNMSRSESSARHGLDDQLTAIWNQVAIFRGEDQNGNTARAGKVDAIEMAESSLGETKTLVFAQLDVIIRSGLEAFHQNDELKRECAQMKELRDSRGREVQRLKASEDDLRASLSVSSNYTVLVSYVLMYSLIHLLHPMAIYFIRICSRRWKHQKPPREMPHELHRQRHVFGEKCQLFFAIEMPPLVNVLSPIEGKFSCKKK